MPGSRPGSAATAGARAPGPAARLARSARVVQVSQLRVKLPVADLPGQVPLRGLADLVAAALLQRQVSQDRPGGRRELITSPSRWRTTSRARVRTAGTPRGRTWRGRPAGSHAARRRAGRAPRLAPGIGQAGAVPFQSRFRPVSVRPPTVPVSPVPGTARRFPRIGDNLCHVSGGRWPPPPRPTRPPPAGGTRRQASPPFPRPRPPAASAPRCSWAGKAHVSATSEWSHRCARARWEARGCSPVRCVYLQASSGVCAPRCWQQRISGSSGP